VIDPYLTALYQIVAAGQKTNSYKFALWRALAHLAPHKLVISKLDLSRLFVEYYWPLELQYHIRQGIDPDKDPIVMKRIRELLASGTIVQGEALGDFQKKSGSGYEKLIAKVAAEAFDDVIPRFHIVRGATIEPKLHVHGQNWRDWQHHRTNDRRKTVFDRLQEVSRLRRRFGVGPFHRRLYISAKAA
jgi:hypothetical protein